MKTLFIGGVKSGKSRLAETYVLERATGKPYYLATAEFIDAELQSRIEAHKHRRQERFITVEEPLALAKALQGCSGFVLVECVSMWLNNMLHHQRPDREIFQEMDALLEMQLDLTLVLNDVGSGVVPDNALARQFVDLSGQLSQRIAARCDAVFLCVAGLSIRAK